MWDKDTEKQRKVSIWDNAMLENSGMRITENVLEFSTEIQEIFGLALSIWTNDE